MCSQPVVSLAHNLIKPVSDSVDLRRRGNWKEHAGPGPV